MNSNHQKFLDEFHRERNTQAFYETRGFKKLWNYFHGVKESDRFQETVLKTRQTYDIPEDGIPLPEKGSWSTPHNDWKHASDKRRYLELREQVRKLSLDYSLLPKDWADIIESYIFHNKVLICLEPNSCNLCFVSDGLTKKDSVGLDVSQDHLTVYPVTLHISPYASKRDILDYVARIYMTEIEPLQKHYQNPNIKIGKFKSRKKSIRERNRFIEENSHLSTKKLLKLVEKTFPELTDSLDEGSIGKIISYGKTRRKKV